MPEEKEIPEFYSDEFQVISGPYGVVINFRKSPREPGPGKVPETVATIRMSHEHTKTMTFILSRHIKGIERDSGVSYPVPGKVLSNLGIAPEDWESFWKTVSEI